MLTEYIYLKKIAIPHMLCKKIIDMFENEMHYDGLTIGGYNPLIKKTKDFVIPKNDMKWNEINDFLHNELTRNVIKYVNNINFKQTVDINFLQYTDFMIQKYVINNGKYVYHNDGYVDYTLTKQRVFTYLFYLNSVESGGETEFWNGKFSIIPEAGNLLLFPANWCFPHCGKIPISSDKYIITGWIYLNDNKNINEIVNKTIKPNNNNNLIL